MKHLTTNKREFGKGLYLCNAVNFPKNVQIVETSESSPTSGNQVLLVNERDKVKRKT